MLPKISLRDIVARLNVSHSTSNRNLKDRSKIEHATLEKESGSRKTKRIEKEKVVDRIDEKGFEKHYFYENMIIKLLEAKKKQTSIDTYLT